MNKLVLLVKLLLCLVGGPFIVGLVYTFSLTAAIQLSIIAIMFGWPAILIGLLVFN